MVSDAVDTRKGIPAAESQSLDRRATFHNLPSDIRCKIYCLRAEGDGQDAGPTSRVKFVWNTSEPLEHECALEQIIALGVRDGIPFIYCADHVYHDDYDRTRRKHMAAIEAYKKFRLVSRMIRADILPFLCARYRIFIDYSILQVPLSSRLSGFVINLLSSCPRIFLKLNESRCGESTCRCTSHNEKDVFRCAWDTDSTAFKERLHGWQQLAGFLAGSPQTRNLRLWFSCEVTSSDTARLVVAPLEKLRVQECYVRLHYIDEPDPILQAIAQRAVTVATSQALSAGFRYLDLPTELRLLILSFTDLAAPPDTPILWRRRTGFHRYDYRYRYYGWRACHGFCTQRNAGYPGCRCRRPPRAFFLVCRQMTRDARRVFYSSNTFNIMSQGYNPTRPTYDHEVFHSSPLEASVFFSRIIPASALQYLHNVKIEFETDEESATRYTTTGIRPEILAHWDQVLARIAPFLADLTLTIRLGPDLPVEIEDPAVRAKQRALFDVHAQLLRPLRRLTATGGLKHFYVHASRKHIDPRELPARSARAIALGEHERRMERLVMGEGYDSVADGKKGGAGWPWVHQEWDICDPPASDSE